MGTFGMSRALLLWAFVQFSDPQLFLSIICDSLRYGPLEIKRPTQESLLDRGSHGSDYEEC
jgi:hypothetical protein